jgi:site-specific DNA recombinase
MRTKAGGETADGGRTKRAFLYLRVSTDEQTKTSYDPDGLSIQAQRQGADDKAEGLNARVAEVFSDPGKSAFKNLDKRTDFLRLLDELRRRNAPGAPKAERIDFVIVWSVSRWARNVAEHWQARDLMNKLGVRFISVMEPIVGDNNAAAFAYENTIIGNAQYHSMYSGELVSRGLLTKARNGGTPGQAKTGYLNGIDKLPNGSQVRTIKPDPARAHFITLGFDRFATGSYTISSLTNELYDLGLRSRPSSRYPGGQKVSTSTWQRILRDPYYLGLVPYKRGTPDEQIFDGLHDALTDEATFEKVQMILDQHRVSGERPQHRHHYLKGSVFCRECELRLTYGVSTGRNGMEYPYFFCTSRINKTPHDCGSRANVKPGFIEDGVQRVYESDLLNLGADDLRARIEAVENLATVSQQVSEQIGADKSKLVEKLRGQQSRLLRLHIEEGDAISPDAFRKERARLQDEIEAAERSLDAAEHRLSLDTELFKMALELVEDLAEVYEDSPEFLRRAYNQAFFEHLWITPRREGESGRPVGVAVEAELAAPYDVLLAPDFAEQARAEVEQIRGANAKDDPGGSPLAVNSITWRHVSIFEAMAEGVGFEPTRRLGRPPVFKTGAFNRSATPPRALLADAKGPRDPLRFACTDWIGTCGGCSGWPRR